MPVARVTASIKAKQSLSDAVDCTAGNLVAILTPAAWDYAAGVSFQISTDGTNFWDLFVDGREVLTAPLTRSVCNILENPPLSWVSHIKLRSGSRDKPVPQTADRTFTLILAK